MGKEIINLAAKDELFIFGVVLQSLAAQIPPIGNQLFDALCHLVPRKQYLVIRLSKLSTAVRKTFAVVVCIVAAIAGAARAILLPEKIRLFLVGVRIFEIGVNPQLAAGNAAAARCQQRVYLVIRDIAAVFRKGKIRHCFILRLRQQKVADRVIHFHRIVIYPVARRVLFHQRNQITDVVGNNSDGAVVGEAAGNQLHIIGVWVVDGDCFSLVGNVAKLVAVQIPNPFCNVLALPFVHAVKFFLGHILSGIQQRPNTLRRLFPGHNNAFSCVNGCSALGNADALRLVPRCDTLRADIEAFAVAAKLLLQKSGSFAQPVVFLEIGADTQTALAVVAAACQHLINNLL